MAARTMEEHLLGNKWQSVIHTARLWPGEYHSSVDTSGDTHNPWGMNIAYFECCTGTPCADNTRASGFLATDMPPADIAQKLVWVASLQGKAFEVQVSHTRHRLVDNCLVMKLGDEIERCTQVALA